MKHSLASRSWYVPQFKGWADIDATRIPAEVVASNASWFAVFNGAIDYVIQNNEKCNKTTWYT